MFPLLYVCAARNYKRRENKVDVMNGIHGTGTPYILYTLYVGKIQRIDFLFKTMFLSTIGETNFYKKFAF